MLAIWNNFKLIAVGATAVALLAIGAFIGKSIWQCKEVPRLDTRVIDSLVNRSSFFEGKAAVAEADAAHQRKLREAYEKTIPPTKKRQKDNLDAITNAGFRAAVDTLNNGTD